MIEQRQIWLLVAGLVIFAGGFILGVAMSARPDPREVASLTGVLILVLLALGTIRWVVLQWLE